MSLTAPLALLALLLVPLVLLLHFISTRWKAREVSSLALWEEVLRSVRTSLRVRRLLASLALLAEVLAVAALAIALAGPLVARRRSPAAGDTVLVLDATASMQARGGRRSRFEEARERAIALVDGLASGARMCVVLAGRQPRLLAPFSGSRTALRRAIASSSATDEAGDPADSLLFALGLRERGRDARLVFITDGCFESLGEADAFRQAIRVELVGGAASGSDQAGNVGITALAFRRGALGDRQLFVSLQSRMPRPASFTLTISTAGEAVAEREISLAPGETLPLTVPWNGPAEGRVTASLAIDDALAVDDRAFAVLAPARPLRVLAVGGSAPYLAAALETFPGLRLTPVANLEPTTADLASWDAVVFDGVAPPPLSRGRFLLFASLPPNLPLEPAGVLASPRFTTWERSHPVLASLALADVAIEAAMLVRTGPGVRVIARSREAPLAATWEREGLRVLFIAFAPERSDLPLRTAFPLLLANALAWLRPGLLGGEAIHAAPGETIDLVLAEEAREVAITAPDGSRRVLPNTGSPFSLVGTPRTGFYRVEAGGEGQDIAVSLCDPAESDLTPRFAAASAAGDESAAPSGVGPVAASSGPEEAVEPAWALFALAALLLVAAEGILWAEGRR